MHSVDVAVIGGGPIGIEMAAALRHAGVSHIHLEAGQIGSTIQWWAPGTRFFSSPERIELAGVPMALTHQDKATREEYLAYLRAVVRLFDLDVRTFTCVSRIEATAAGFRITAAQTVYGVGGPGAQDRSSRPDALIDATWPAQRIVLAIGNMHRPRMLGVPGENLPHVSHYLGEPHEYFGRRVLIVGGKNSAVEAALRLYRAGAKVALSYRGAEFDAKRVKYWLLPELLWLISKDRIEFHPRTIVRAVRPDCVELAPVDDSAAARDIPADAVLLLTGYVQDPELFNQIGIELNGLEMAPRFDATTMETSVPGVYVAGTAAGGSQQRARLFIENSHIHVQKIMRSIAGVDVPWPIRANEEGPLEH